MENKGDLLDQRGDFTAPPEGASDYPKKPEHRKIEKQNKRK